MIPTATRSNSRPRQRRPDPSSRATPAMLPSFPWRNPMSPRIVAAALLALLLAPWSSPAPAQTPALKVATIGIMGDIGLFTGIERGYFAERGLKIELVPIAGAGDVISEER